jgi:putative membrane protein
MEIPVWAKKHLHPQKVDGILAAIQAAEMKTSGEIIPMIVRQSSAFGHVPVIIGSGVIIILLLLKLINIPDTHMDHYYLWYIVDFILIVGAIAILSRSNSIKRLLTAQSDQIYQVGLRAEVEFFEAGMRNTAKATGILLFVSLVERRAVVLADKSIADKLPDSIWEEICSILVEGSKNKSMEAAFSEAITKCGDILALHFPRQQNDKNELKDHLIIKE